jgi:hypothetical protein
MRFAVLCMCAALGGCATIPLGLKIAALVGSGVSYVSTGKLLSDHALSAALDGDCRLTSALNGDRLCAASVPTHATPTGDVGAPSNSVTDDVPSPTPGPANPVPDSFLVIGSFGLPENASRWQARHAQFEPRLYRVRRARRELVRVVIGPLSHATSRPLRERLSAVGIDDPWPIQLCTATMSKPPCHHAAAGQDLPRSLVAGF